MKKRGSPPAPLFLEGADEENQRSAVRRMSFSRADPAVSQACFSRAATWSNLPGSALNIATGYFGPVLAVLCIDRASTNETAPVCGLFRSRGNPALLLDRYRSPGKKRLVEVERPVVCHFKPKPSIGLICRYEMKENIRQFVCDSLPKFFQRGLHANPHPRTSYRKLTVF